MGSDLSGEIAKSHAFRVFNSSYELNASVPAVVVVAAEDLPPVNLPYVALHTVERPGKNESFQRNSTFDTSAKPGGGGSLLDLCERPAGKMRNGQL
jgi:hypothetical protein